jgi:hypothetical protein
VKHVAYFHKGTGQLYSVTITVSDDDAVKLNTPDGHEAVEIPPGVRVDPQSQRVDLATKKIVDYQPPQPAPDNVWNATTKRWQPSAVKTAQTNADLRARRQIRTLEDSQHRVIRECQLGVPGAQKRLKEIDDKIAQLRPALAAATNQD